MDKNLTEEDRQIIRVANSKERYARQQDAKDYLKFSIYHQQERQNKNRLHSLFDGKVFRTDDPYIYAVYPPNCMGCNCVITTISERKFKNMNGVVLDVKEYLLSLLKSGDITIEEIKEMEKFDPRKY